MGIRALDMYPLRDCIGYLIPSFPTKKQPDYLPLGLCVDLGFGGSKFRAFCLGLHKFRVACLGWGFKFRVWGSKFKVWG